MGTAKHSTRLAAAMAIILGTASSADAEAQARLNVYSDDFSGGARPAPTGASRDTSLNMGIPRLHALNRRLRLAQARLANHPMPAHALPAHTHPLPVQDDTDGPDGPPDDGPPDDGPPDGVDDGPPGDNADNDDMDFGVADDGDTTGP